MVIHEISRSRILLVVVIDGIVCKVLVVLLLNSVFGNYCCILKCKAAMGEFMPDLIVVYCKSERQIQMT